MFRLSSLNRSIFFGSMILVLVFLIISVQAEDFSEPTISIALEVDNVEYEHQEYEYEYEYENEYEYEYEGNDEGSETDQTSSDDDISSDEGQERKKKTEIPIITDSQERFRAAFICLDAERLLCLGVSTDGVPQYNPNNAILLQVKQRARNEIKGTDFLKMRWELDLVENQIRLASAKDLCLSRLSKNNNQEVALRPCDAEPRSLNRWNIPFAADDDSDTVHTQLGVLTLQAFPDRCLTLMKCSQTTRGYCSPYSTEPFAGTFDVEGLSGAYVKFSPCQQGSSNQILRQIRNCSPECSTVMMDNEVCDEPCRNPYCGWDNGACDPDPNWTWAPTTGHPTTMPSVSPTKSPRTSKPTKSPTNKPTGSKPTTSQPTLKPTNTPTRTPTNQPTDKPTTLKPTSLSSKSPTRKPTNQPTPRPSSSPIISTFKPTQSPTQNLTLLEGGVPTENISDGQNLWWAWLILALLLCCFTSMVTYFACGRYRKRLLDQAAQERSRQRAAKFLDNERFEIDLEMGNNNNIQANSEFQLEDPMGNNAREASSRPSPIRPPPPPAYPPMMTPVKNVSFCDVFEEDEEMKRKRKEEEKEAKARKMAKRSVMNLLNAMNDLEEAFQIADKELGQDDEEEVVRPNQSTTTDNELSILDDGENKTPNPISADRVSGSTPLKKRTPSRRQLARMERKETQNLMMEVKSRRLDQAISRVERAIGSLENKINHEQVKMVHEEDRASVRSASNGGYGDLDTTVNSVELLDQMEKMNGGGNGFSYIVSRSSRGEPAV